MGRRKAKEEINCTRRVTVRIKDQTFQRLKTLAGSCNCRSVGGVIKHFLVNQKILVFYQDTAFCDCVQELIKAREELRAIGHNINQITHHFHSADNNHKKMFYALKVGEEYAKVGDKVEEYVQKVAEIGQMWLARPQGKRKTLEEI